MNNIKNFHLINVKFFPETPDKECYLSLKSGRFWLKRDVVKIPFNELSCETLRIQACNWLEKRGFEIVGTGDNEKNSFIVITSTFKSLSKVKNIK